ncbi:psbP domain-containing protein 2, chloroplastic-like [Bidens hawaiensis]|uniref:psbP domain-containing protein 2, chloroplastic-like n=1 Tax=Bidens hawaiensis TaxID=980011 RepID=UPI00404A8D54
MWASSCGLKINPTILPQNTLAFNQSSSSSSSSPQLQSPCISNHQRPNGFPLQFQPTRRKLINISILSTVVPPFASSWAETEEAVELERYTDVNVGFTLLRPKSWIKVEKAGATLLFEDPSKGSNNVGVVVTPVRLTSLAEFGDPEFVSNKLIQAEKRKESTKDVEIVSFREKPRKKGDVQVYEFEYNLDSTRGGLKKIFSAAFVASKKLYLLNIAHSQQPPLSSDKRMMLEKVLHSFDVPSST